MYFSFSFKSNINQDPELTSQRPKEQNCLMGCCNPNFEDPNGCQSKVSKKIVFYNNLIWLIFQTT